MLTKTNENQVIMSDRTYDVSKKLVHIWLPAFSALYFGLASIWDLPAAEKVVGTIAVFTTFLGVVLNVSHNRYKESDASVDGDLVVTTNGDRTVASLQLNDEASVITNKQTIKFRVRENPLTIEDVEDSEEL